MSDDLIVPRTLYLPFRFDDEFLPRVFPESIDWGQMEHVRSESAYTSYFAVDSDAVESTVLSVDTIINQITYDFGIDEHPTIRFIIRPPRCPRRSSIV